jgi:hypothetical protein
LLLYLLFLEKQKRKEQSISFKTMLDDDGKRCHDFRIPHAAQQSPKESSFLTLFEPGDDQALITLTGFDHANLQELHNCLTLFSMRLHPSPGVQMVLTWK